MGGLFVFEIKRKGAENSKSISGPRILMGFLHDARAGHVTVSRFRFFYEIPRLGIEVKESTQVRS